jgi:multidrug transporter EmrE-like cation transporter
MSIGTLALILVSVSFNAFAQVVLRLAMLRLGPVPSISDPVELALTFIRNFYLWGGVACYVISLATWLAVLSRTQVSIAYPMLSIGYIIATVLGVAFLGETVNPARVGGIMLICLGVAFVARTA